LKNFFMGQFGHSFHYGQPVVEIISDRLPPSSSLPSWA
jgi:peptide/nickel transport system permease protein